VQSPTAPSLLNSLLPTLTNGAINTSSGHLILAEQSAVNNAFASSLPSLFTTRDAAYNSSLPKAFLNWALFDERMNYVSGGVTQVPTVNPGDYKKAISASLPTTITKNGYLYVYVSNESPQDVFFDNVTIQHKKGPLLEDTHYYPFGLEMPGISSKALSFGGSENKYKYNGGNELQSKEFSDGSGLELYDAKYRLYDPQIGRFMQIDPLSDFSMNLSTYTFASNNPINRNDPWGLKDTVVNGQVVQRDKDLKEVVVTPRKPSSTLHFTNGFFRALDNYSHEERMQDQTERREFDQGHLDKVSTANKKIFTHWKKTDEEWHALSYTLVGSMVTPIVISAIPVASISAGYTTLSTEAFDATLFAHYQTNLAINSLRIKILEGLVGVGVASMGKDAMYSQTLWKMSDMTKSNITLKGQTVSKIVSAIMRVARKL